MRKTVLAVVSVCAAAIAVVGYLHWTKRQHAVEAETSERFARKFVRSAFEDSEFYRPYIPPDERGSFASQRKLMSRSFTTLLVEDQGGVSCCWQYIVTYSNGNISHLDVHILDGAVDWASAETDGNK